MIGLDREQNGLYLLDNKYKDLSSILLHCVHDHHDVFVSIHVS